MILNVFKKGCKRLMMPYFSQSKLTILPVLQKGYRIDFIRLVEGNPLTYQIDLSYVLHPNFYIKNVAYQCGDSTVILNDFVFSKRKFLVTITGGKANTKSTILFKIISDSGLEQVYTILLDVISQAKAEYEYKKNIRQPELWVLDSDPKNNYQQEFGSRWIEGDLILNENNFQLWQYNPNIDEKWNGILALQGLVAPVNINYRIHDQTSSSKTLENLYADEGKIQSNKKGDLSIQGNLKVKTVHTNACISGKPLGKGISIITDGMISGQSLYIASLGNKPKNMYIGCDGVVSTKHLSSDFLQLALFTVEELPKNVPMGVLILCQNYNSKTSPVLLCSIKEKPQSIDDWYLLNDHSLNNAFSLEKENNIPSGKPNLSVISSDYSYSDDDKIVEIRPSITKKIPRNGNDSSSYKLETNHYYHHFEIFKENFGIPASNEKMMMAHKLILDQSPSLQYISGEWKRSNESWSVPQNGLLQLNGWFIFEEEEIDLSGPISYHAGDQLVMKILKSNKNINSQPIYEMEFPLVPYVNDVTNTVCASPKLTFSYSYPIQQKDKICFEAVYLHQSYSLNKNLSLKIKKLFIELLIF